MKTTYYRDNYIIYYEIVKKNFGPLDVLYMYLYVLYLIVVLRDILYGMILGTCIIITLIQSYIIPDIRQYVFFSL